MPSCVKQLKLSLLASTLALAMLPASAQGQFPITDAQRQTASQVAQAGVPLSELSPDAPDSHTVKAGDTLWDISKLFLKSPWRWPELWGMNRDQIANPHLIYPGQVLVLVKKDGRAQLLLGEPRGPGADMQGLPSGKLSPQVRASKFEDTAILAIPQHLIEPFLTEAVVLDTDSLNKAPRIVAASEGRVMMTRGDLAYARGDMKQARDWRVFRQAKPLRDPATNEVLGYEAPYLGTAELTRLAEEAPDADGKSVPTASTLTIKTVRQEIGPGDRLAPVLQREFIRYVPHSPAGAMNGQIISVYGDALTGGQNQIVSLNRGRRDGVERGHVLALWQDGRRITDSTGEKREQLKLPDERHGVLFVFQVYERVSYALIVSVKQPVQGGDRFTQP